MKTMLAAGIILIIAGALQSPAFNGLDMLGWAVALAGGALAVRRARRTT
jgi:hypothetical protein